MSETGLLAGLRVVDLAGELASYAGKLLAELGADVILVEPPEGHRDRRVPPLVATTDGREASAHFAFAATGKRSLRLDRATARGAEVFDLLIGSADVVVATPDPDELVTWDATVAAWHVLRPRLVIAAVTPFGLRGPRRGDHGSDLVAWAASGALPSCGDPDRAPLSPPHGLGYFASANAAAMGAMMAVRTSRLHGVGQVVDVSVQEAVMSTTLEAGPYMFMESAEPQVRSGRRRRTPPMGQYPTTDGAVTIIGYTPWQWDALAEWIAEETGNETVLLDTFHGTPAARAPFVDVIDVWVEELTSRYDKQTFFEEAQRRGIPTGALNGVADLFEDPHFAATGGWQTVEDPELGPIRVPRPPVRVDGRITVTRPGPRLGEHTDEVLAELGIDADQRAALRTAGVV